MASAFDVVIVPDFSCAEAATFEARTLLFLASWLVNAGQARAFPLHLACIGQPPPSVYRLADKAGASITVHQPVRAEGWGSANKLRGLEVAGKEDRVLLLDADVIVLSDFSDLANLGRCIAASPANTVQISEPHWERIYAALGIEPPSERIACVRDELAGAPSSGSMWPYYNSGVLFLPWACELRTIWEEHIRRIPELFNERDKVWGAIARSDQAGLATSIQSLRLRGVPFVRLPPAFHVNWLHMYWRKVPIKKEGKLFHAFGLFRQNAAGLDALDREIRLYRTRLIQSLVHESKRDLIWGVARRLLPAAIDACALGTALQKLYRREVAGTLANDLIDKKAARKGYRDSHMAATCAADFEAHYARGRGYFYWQYFEKPYLETLFARLAKESPGRYLDFACGTGRILQLAAPYFTESIGVDVSGTMLAVAGQRVPRARLIRADITIAPPEVGSFSVITLFRFLLNAEDGLRKSVLRWLRAIIAPKGVLVVNNHLNRSSISGISRQLRNFASRRHRYPVLSDGEVENLLRDCGFEIFDCYGFGFLPPTQYHRVLPLSLLACLERRMQRIKSLRTYSQDRIYLCHPV